MTLELLLTVAAVPFIIAFAAACLRDPLRHALPAYAALVPFSSLLSFAPGRFGSLSTILGLVLGVALLGQLVTTRRGSPRIPLEVPIWLAFLAWCGLSIFWSIAPRATAEDFALLASLVLLFVALALTRVDPLALRRFELGTVLGGVLIVAYGVAQLALTGQGAGVSAARFGDDLLGANNQAAALLLPIAITAARAVTGPRVGGHRLAYGAATLFMVLGVILTGSRGGLLATLVVLGSVLFFTGARTATKLALTAAAAVLLAVVLLVNPGGVGERQVTNDTSSGRSEIWAVGLHSCRLYCLTGAGWGSFPVVYEEEQPSVPEARALKGGTAYEPHNILLLAAVEVGVPGLLLVLAALAVATRSALRLPRYMRGPPAAALAGTLVSSFFLSNLEFKFFWAVLMYVVISSSVAAVRREERPSRAARPEGPLAYVSKG